MRLKMIKKYIIPCTAMTDKVKPLQTEQNGTEQEQAEKITKRDVERERETSIHSDSTMTKCCSICGGSELSGTQRKKSVNIRRCCTCVRKNIWPSTLTEDETNKDEDRDPDFVQVDIIDRYSEQEFPQTETEFGRSIHVDNNTCYKIRIKSSLRKENGKRPQIAVIVKVDGDKVSPTPILVGAERCIEGFTISRKTLEEVSNTISSYKIRKKTDEFRAVFPQGSSERSINKADGGTIELRFFCTKMVRMQPGTRQRNHRGESNSKEQQRQKQARYGLMVTLPGKSIWEDGGHSGGNSKPMADLSRPLGTSRLHICNKKVLTLGDYIL